MITQTGSALSDLTWVLILVGSVVVVAALIIVLMLVLPSMKAKRASVNADKIINDAKTNADKIIKNAQYDAKQHAYEVKQETDKEIKEKKQEILQQENKLQQRENSMNERDKALLRKEELLVQKEKSVDAQIEDNKRKAQSLNDKLNSVLGVLENIGKFTEKEARDEIFRRVEEKEQQNIAKYMKEKEEEAESIANEKAKEILSMAMARQAQEVTTERTEPQFHYQVMK